jgi:hypothetical protein
VTDESGDDLQRNALIRQQGHETLPKFAWCPRFADQPGRVDPTKFDFYMMDCYRHLAEDRLAETLANEVIQASTDFNGTERAPCA